MSQGAAEGIGQRRSQPTPATGRPGRQQGRTRARARASDVLGRDGQRQVVAGDTVSTTHTEHSPVPCLGIGETRPNSVTRMGDKPYPAWSSRISSPGNYRLWRLATRWNSHNLYRQTNRQTDRQTGRRRRVTGGGRVVPALLWSGLGRCVYCCVVRPGHRVQHTTLRTPESLSAQPSPVWKAAQSTAQGTQTVQR